MDEIDNTQTLNTMYGKQKKPYPYCRRCGMYGTPGTSGKCPFCGEGEMR